jgi:hypothetical protein
MATMIRKWNDVRAGFAATQRDAEARMLDALAGVAEETAPAYQLSIMDHHARARRISCMSIVAKVRAASAPAPDPGKLEALLEAHPRVFPHTPGGLHRLEEQIRATPGWLINPPLDEDVVLRTMAPEERGQWRILVELARAGAFNGLSALAVAFRRAGEKWKDLFGTVDIATESAEITEAVKQVAEARAALNAQPDLLAKLAARHGVRATADDVLAAVAAARSSRG